MFSTHARRMRVLLVVAFAAVGAAVTYPGGSARCDAKRPVSVTVYNQDLALVREARGVVFEAGSNDVSFTDVASKIDPTSVLVSFPGRGPAVRVASQSYRYDVAGTGRLLEIALGKEVSVRTEGGELFRGLLVGYDNDSLVIREDSGSTAAVSRDKTTDVRFYELGKELALRPTLTWQMISESDGPRDVEVSYLTSGMTWHAEYAAKLSADEKSMELLAWASIDNKTGMSFEDAALTLIAGKVNRAAEVRRPRMEFMAAEAKAAPAFTEEEVFEYHAYNLDKPLTVSDNESVQLTLFEPAQVAFQKVFTYDPSVLSNGVKVTARTENVEDKGLGVPMPEGVIRVYSPEGAGARLVGEDLFKPAAVGAEIELALGLAFDVTGERKRVGYERLGSDLYEESYELVLSNGKSEAVEVLVLEHPRGDWKITENSLAYEQKDSNTVQWTVKVPPSGEAKISYTVQFRS
jgi:hypothetical protein